jgi:hypothetical protein
VRALKLKGLWHWCCSNLLSIKANAYLHKHLHKLLGLLLLSPLLLLLYSGTCGIAAAASS